jgi:hypothetical protein
MKIVKPETPNKQIERMIAEGQLPKPPKKAGNKASHKAVKVTKAAFCYKHPKRKANPRAMLASPVCTECWKRFSDMHG